MCIKDTMTDHFFVQKSTDTGQFGYSSFNGLNAVLPRGIKVAIVLCLSDRMRIDWFYDAACVYFLIVDKFFCLSETVEFPSYFKIHPTVNGNCFLVVLQNFQQVLTDTGFLKKWERVCEDFSGYILSSVLFYCSGSGIIGCWDSVECSYSV